MEVVLVETEQEGSLLAARIIRGQIVRRPDSVLGLATGGRVAPADAANPLPALALLAYMGFISAAAYSLWSMALAANPVSRVAVFGFMNPVFGAVLSALLLGETSVVNPVLAVVALALVSTGIVVVNRGQQ